MKRLLVLGGGTAGTMLVNRLYARLDLDRWRVSVVDRDDEHHFRPSYLHVPFGTVRHRDVVRSRSRYLPDGVELRLGEIAALDPDAATVTLASGEVLGYDLLVIATGSAPRPDQTPGLLGPLWRRSVHEFYTLEGARALAGAVDAFAGGRLVVHVSEMPISCPVAPLEMALLLEARLRERGLRERSELVFVTPLDGAFTTPAASRALGDLLERRSIDVETDFVVSHLEHDPAALVSYDERRVPFDLLVSVPVHMGADFIARSGLGDELGHVEVDPATLRSLRSPNVYALGDAAALPVSKAGSAAHHAVEPLVENLLAQMGGREPTHRYDGHVTCFVETGDGAAVLLDFDYRRPPGPGRYPLPALGPFTLLEETRANLTGKALFRWTYWNALLRGHDLPLPDTKRPERATEEEVTAS